MSKLFNASRLKLARERRKMTYKSLADHCGISSKMASLYEKFPDDYQPTETTVDKISSALAFPKDFFYQDSIEELEFETVAFRSLKTLRAAQKNAATGAGRIGILLNDYFERKFNLPHSNIPDYGGFPPEEVALLIRAEWNLGDKSISNLINLLEAYGVRVFSLSENAQEVDAFSFWKGGIPFVFLNTKKTPERSRFDCAHELGHLLMHRYSENKGNDIEKEADRFASAFLMPESSIRVNVPRFITANEIIKVKSRWRVSAMALTYRLKALDHLTEWQYRNLIIELSKMGYRSNEPIGIEREKSTLLENLLTELSKNRVYIVDIARELRLPVDEISSLLFKFSVVSSSSATIKKTQNTASFSKPQLYIV
ncbi:ImmA/IrrE family metallo-endopeptidase [Marinomonas rhizomae]|nr:XRE family transcriptional regulator [Marinomonas rhizomae]RNF72506.1 ImmA/IrrE family metallo-endopeptidase [Marinomonas rhizomae]